MLNFRKLYEFIFKPFDIARDTELVENYANEGVRFIMLIKRSWIYGLFVSGTLLVITGIAIVNLTLMNQHFDGKWEGYIAMTLLAINIVLSVAVSLRYLIYFRRVYGTGNDVTDIHTLHAKLVQSDVLFTEFFNQIIFNYLFFLGIIVFYVVHVVLFSNDFLWSTLDVLCIIGQLALLHSYTKSMINIEMDFVIIIPGKIIAVDQKGVMNVDTQTLEAEKIKTVKSSYPNFLGSFFKYGTIEVLTEGDDVGQIGTLKFQYVDDPEATVDHMLHLLERDTNMAEKIHNVYLRKIIANYQLDEHAPTFRDNLKQFLHEYEKHIEKDYIEAQDAETKREIEEIYRRYWG